MITSLRLSIRSKPGTFERMVHRVALAGSFLLLGGVVIFADMRPSTRHAALKTQGIEAAR